MPIESRDIAVVDQIVRRHPQAGNLRLSHTQDAIEVLLRRALNVNDMLATFGIQDADSPAATGQAPGFAPALRFVLVSEQPRLFRAERAGPAGMWEPMGPAGLLPKLVRQGITALDQ